MACPIQQAEQNLFRAEDKLREVEKKMKEFKTAHNLAKLEYNAARTALENTRKADYEAERGVKTAMFRHSDGFTYLHEPGVELSYVEWQTPRRGVNKFREDLVLAVVWGQDDPKEPLYPKEGGVLYTEQTQLRKQCESLSAEVQRVVRLSMAKTIMVGGRYI